MKKLILVIFAMIVSFGAMAQVTTSGLTGKVTTESGEALIGATVIATHTPSGTEYGAVASLDGRYNIQGMRAGGPYTVEISYVGYQTVEFNGVSLPLGETAVRDAYLVDSNALEAIVVSVDGSESAMNVKRSGASTSISKSQMEAMPSVSRSMNDIMRLTPQSSSSTGSLSIGGGNYRSSYVTVDGAAFNNAFGIGSNLPAGGTPISLDALEMVTVSVTPYDVRQSGFTGGAISAVTKSGTNNLEISAYNYYESDALQGTKLADGVDLTTTESLSNTVGFTIGAPIIKDKLFIFANLEYEAETVPGQSRLARESEDDEWGSSVNNYNRPTVDQMEEIRDYLIETYDYDPGRYQNYSIDIPNYKFMARVDWNINDNHRMNARFSHTTTKGSNSPSSSISPLSSTTYNRYTQGRTLDNALYFESSRYYQEQNFTSIAAELNSRFMDGKLNNIFRATYSHQYEPRSYEGDLFPTVDIMEVDDDGVSKVLTTFGVDPFTYGNLRDVSTYTITDEVTYSVGKHNLLAGLQFEYDNTINGFMQGGAGYYVFGSWDDFVNNAEPIAFAMTHANNDELEQEFPTFDYYQYSAYIQDEITISDRLKATVGLRFELPVMPSLASNENKEFTELFANLGGYKTSDMPASSLSVAPRVGFNYDLTGERKYILRGGSGIFTGRIPFVWIVSAFGNSNCLQAQVVYDAGTQDSYPLFSNTIDGILENLYDGTFEAGELAAPTATTIMDTNLKMPSTWKSSLAFEANLPSDIHFTLEGIYNHDYNSVVTQRLALTEVDGGIQLPGEPEARTLWSEDGITNSDGDAVKPYYLTNSDINGYYASITAQLSKSFISGLNLSASYTYSASKNVTDGTGDQTSSSYNSGTTYGRNGSNVAELGHSSFVSPNRVLVNASYRKEYGGNFATTVGLFYEGSHMGYYGYYSYARYSYTMTNVTGDSGNYNLLYVPTDTELASMPFVDSDNRDAYQAFINGDKYLSSIKGEYSERGGAVAPWHNSFSLKVAQDFFLNVNGHRNTLTIGLDVNNVANLLNRNWGSYEYTNSTNILTYSTSDAQYTFSEPTTGNYVNAVSAWSALFSVRYTFK